MSRATDLPDAWRRTVDGKTRLRGLGLKPPGLPGPFNAITDVAGVAVGHRTLVRGDGPLQVGQGPVRTGVSAILPRGQARADRPVFAGLFSLNGNGELTGSHWIAESGLLEGPVLLTNTHSCGLARDSAVKWLRARVGQPWILPVAAETYDGDLNDIDGHHVTEEDVLAALDAAAPGPFAMGSVGGGTGMITYEFKAGVGSASRQVTVAGADYTLGVYVQANFGLRPELVVAGVPVGRHIRGDEMRGGRDQGSIIAMVATDAPLLPHQLTRLTRRLPMALARTGAIAHNGSGDIFLAFSTAATVDPAATLHQAAWLDARAMDPLFNAVVEAGEEAILDSLVVNDTMVGRDGVTARALPHDRLCDLVGTAPLWATPPA